MADVRVTDWTVNAACKGMATSLFFPARGEDVDPRAADACDRCPMATRQACLEEALNVTWLQDQGYRAGMSAKKRRAIRERRRRAGRVA